MPGSRYIYLFADPNIKNEISLRYTAKHSSVHELKSKIASSICVGHIKDMNEHYRVRKRLVIHEPIRFDSFTTHEYKELFRYLKQKTKSYQLFTITGNSTRKNKYYLNIPIDRYHEVHQLAKRYVARNNLKIKAMQQSEPQVEDQEAVVIKNPSKIAKSAFLDDDGDYVKHIQKRRKITKDAFLDGSDYINYIETTTN